MKRRHVPKYSSLTSLLDVLFILMFASLAQAAALVERVREQRDEKKHVAPVVAAKDKKASGSRDAGVGSALDAGAVDAAIVKPNPRRDAGTLAGEVQRKQLHDQALAKLTRGLQRRRPIYAYVSSIGVLAMLRYDDNGKDTRVQLSRPLVHETADRDLEWVYRNAGICTIVRDQLKLRTLENELVIVVYEPSKDPLSQDTALIEGLRTEPSRCGFKGLLDVSGPPDPPAKAQP